MTSIYTPPAPDKTANQFKRSIVSGKFIVQDRFSSYDVSGNPSGVVVDTGNSFFTGMLQYLVLQQFPTFTPKARSIQLLVIIIPNLKAM